jgi:choline-glycine betaine transporter
MLPFFRFLAGVVLLIAVIAAVYDGTRSLGAGGLVMTSLLEHWSKLAPTLLAASQSGVQRATHPLVWDVGVRKLLGVPAWAAFAVLGLLLAYAGRRRRRVNVFAN